MEQQDLSFIADGNAKQDSHFRRHLLTKLTENAMAPHSSTLAWKIPWMEEPGGLQSMESLRVRHDFTFTFYFHALQKEMATHSSVLAWRIPGTGSLVGCRLWGRTESDMTKVTQQQQQQERVALGSSQIPGPCW